MVLPSLRRVVASVLVLFLAISSFAQALPAAESLDFSPLEKAIQEELAVTGTPGMAVAVIHGDRVVFAKGFGTSNVETGAPVTTGTIFQIGSVTKLLTATAVAGLAEEGKIRLDAPAGTYVQGLAPRLSEVTTHQLLSQTAGLKDEPAEYGPHDESALAAAARSWQDDHRPLPPGTAFSYSNPGFALAGLVLQEAGGKPYADLMAERLFTPLGMSRTTFRPALAMTWPLSMGHAADTADTADAADAAEGDDKPKVVRPMADDARYWPAGSTVYTSADDLARFVQAFLNGGRLDGKQVLSPAVIARVSTPHAEIPALFEEGRYGYGLFLFKERGLRVAEHAGTMTGFSALVRMVPEHRFGLVALANHSDVRLERTAEAAMRLLLPVGPETVPEERPAILMSAAERAGYAGTYTARWPMELFEKDGKLFLRRFGQELEVAKIGDRRFRVQLPGAPRPQEFVLGPAGADGKPLYLHMFLWAFPRVGADSRGPSPLGQG
jgi:CubicO group peptidase (beta-lactamase class C family)